MRSLSEVMDYFIQTSGGREHTRPMETNDLTLLGLRNPDYDTHIPIGKWFLQVFYFNINIETKNGDISSYWAILGCLKGHYAIYNLHRIFCVLPTFKH